MGDERPDAAERTPDVGGGPRDGDAGGLDERIRAAAADYHRPPETPRDAMWERIRAARAAGGPRRALEGRARRPWLAWVTGIAAVLALGIAIGRLSVPGAAGPGASDVAGAMGAPTGAAAGENRRAGPGAGAVGARPSDAAYRLAATGHLDRVEAFLTQFRAEAESGRVDPGLRAPARQLLSNTRLLLASPAADDPSLRAVLDDVELVLAQIARYSAEPSREDLHFIDDGIEQRGLLLELRTVVTAASPPGLAQGAL